MENLLIIGLRRIDWETLQSVSRIENIEENLKNLTSNDDSVSEKAYWNICNNMVLQGDLYEFGFYIIPFLLKILAGAERIDKILDLLFEFSNGSSYNIPANIHDCVTYIAVETPFLFYLPSHDKNAQTKTLEKACKDAIFEQADILIHHLVRVNATLSNYRTILDIFLNLRDYGIKKRMMTVSSDIMGPEKKNILNEYLDEL